MECARAHSPSFAEGGRTAAAVAVRTVHSRATAAAGRHGPLRGILRSFASDRGLLFQSQDAGQVTKSLAPNEVIARVARPATGMRCHTPDCSVSMTLAVASKTGPPEPVLEAGNEEKSGSVLTLDPCCSSSDEDSVEESEDGGDALETISACASFRCNTRCFFCRFWILDRSHILRSFDL